MAKNLQLSTLERVCESLDVPMWEVVRDASGLNCHARAGLNRVSDSV
jgi:hypothetical protein